MTLITNSRKRIAYAKLPVHVRKRRIGAPPPDLERCAVDPAYFIATYVTIDNAQPDSDDAAATMPFDLWPAQADLLTTLRAERLVLILKARQLGISWLVCAYALWLCLFRDGRLVLLFSIGQNESNELQRRIAVMYWRLPEHLRAALPKNTRDNTSAMAWANGSRAESLPTTRNSGSSFTASLLILDEFSKNQLAESLYTAAKPTIDGGGSMIILSSANGVGNLFHDMCERAMNGAGRFVFRFLPWWARPGRDAAWYAQTEADAVSSALMRQEYPAEPAEAFEATGAERFIPSITWWDACKEELPPLTTHEPLVLALDAGDTSDTFAAVAVSRHPERYDDAAVRYVRVWEPRNGEPLDLQAIEDELRVFVLAYNVVQLCFDKYQLRQMTQRLATIVWCEEFSQSTDRLIADKHLYDLIQTQHIAHSGETDLRQHIDNADRKIETQERLRIVKRRASLKVDLAVALSMSAYRMLTEFQ